MPEEQALFSHARERVILGKESCSSTEKTTSRENDQYPVHFLTLPRWDHVENR